MLSLTSTVSLFGKRSRPSITYRGGYTGKFLANDPSRLRANAIKPLELMCDRPKLVNSDDIFATQAGPNGERETETSDRASPTLVVVIGHRRLSQG